MRKFKTITVVLLGLILVVLAIGLLVHVNKTVKVEDKKEVKECIEKVEECRIISYGESCMSEDEEIYAMQFICEEKGVEKSGFFYFKRDKVFKNRYMLTGGMTGDGIGVITADSQTVDGIEYVFIRGMKLKKGLSKVEINELDYMEEITEINYLDIIETDKGDSKFYEVTMKE